MLCFIFAIVFSTQTLASPLSDAKNQGLVGELSNGYLASPNGNASTTIQALIKQTNRKRKQKYQEISKRNNIPVSKVEKLIADKIYKKAGSGEWFQKNGQWVKKWGFFNFHQPQS